jgi:hypothetical protein
MQVSVPQGVHIVCTCKHKHKNGYLMQSVPSRPVRPSVCGQLLVRTRQPFNVGTSNHMGIYHMGQGCSLLISRSQGQRSRSHEFTLSKPCPDSTRQPFNVGTLNHMGRYLIGHRSFLLISWSKVKVT